MTERNVELSKPFAPIDLHHSLTLLQCWDVSQKVKFERLHMQLDTTTVLHVVNLI